MEYKSQRSETLKVKPRLIIHGGAGNITHAYLQPKDWEAYRKSLLTILAKTNTYMTTRLSTGRLPSALETATHAVSLLENDPLYNSGHGAVFTRDGINELEASVMVSRGHKKRAVGVSGGVVCVATSTGGLTNKLSGRIGDTPTVGAGFWAGEWEDDGDDRLGSTAWDSGVRGVLGRLGSSVGISDGLRRLLADCLPQPLMYTPLPTRGGGSTTVTRSFAGSGTGNGDSFLRVDALHSVASRAQWKREPSAKALSAVAGPRGELQKSAGDRWGRTGEGQGGIIGIELTVVRGPQGDVLETRSEVLQDYNCAGMFRAWVDDDGRSHAEVWRGDSTVGGIY
ncbi:hypothetical protein VdG1_09476 [Verticillium dahliae VDG1]|nr:hypothetical protein VdG1_09476 [Verticillium dahliae VDG1]